MGQLFVNLEIVADIPFHPITIRFPELKLCNDGNINTFKKCYKSVAKREHYMNVPAAHMNSLLCVTIYKTRAKTTPI